MRKHINTTKNIEKEEMSSPKKKKNKDWILEYKWKSVKDFNTFCKDSFFHKNNKYEDGWLKRKWNTKFYTIIGAKQSLLSEIKDKWRSMYIKGRWWRIKNIKTGEIVDFTEIQEYEESTK